MKYYIVAGEASGDMHGANLIGAIKGLDTEAEFRVWGGDKMQDAGAVLVKHYRELAFMGFAEVIANLRTILRNLEFCKKDILEYSPDALILIDYPGFNLRLAPFAKKHSIKSFYYILPQLWAWKKGRVKILEKNIESAYSILPFEVDFYKDYDLDFHYVGHPLLDEVEKYSQGTNENNSKPVLLLLPGSRLQEVKRIFPIMLKAVQSRKDKYDIVVGKASSLDAVVYEEFLRNHPEIELSEKGTYALLSMASMALVTSGTATLETAIFRVPQIVCYKGSFLSYQIAKRIVDVPYISLVNLIADKEVVKELIQEELSLANLEKELALLEKDESRKEMLANYDELIHRLGKGGASLKAASLMLKTLRN